MSHDFTSGPNIGALIAEDDLWKPKNADREWMRAHEFYEDQSRHLTHQRLKALGVGLADNPAPLEANLLRRFIDRLAVIYQRPPTRWLLDGDEQRLEEISEPHQAMVKVLKRSQYDLAWRRADRLRALMRQVAVRFYPQDERGSVVSRIFQPFNIVRAPSVLAPDIIESDRAFAFRLHGGSSTGHEEHRQDGHGGSKPKSVAHGADAEPSVWEHWWKDAEGVWHMVHLNQKNDLEREQPFEETDGFANPYDEVPALLVYDDYPGGRAWLPPRESRTAWTDAINAVANDLWNLVVHEAHTEKVVATDDTSQVPTEHGPGKTWVLPKDAVAQILNHSPKITESRDLLESFVRLWTLSEDLPVSEFDRTKQLVTGASLRVQSRPLLDRRECQIPLAENDELLAYRKFRAVHNLHTKDSEAETWKGPLLDEETEIEAEVAPLDLPTDPKDTLDVFAREIAMGSKSMIDLIQAMERVDRPKAERQYFRVQSDAETFPPLTDPAGLQQGTRTAGVSANGEIEAPTIAPETTEEQVGANSVIAAVQDIGEDIEDPAAVALPGVDASQSALNGAQVSAAKDIVNDVAAGQLPRATGVSMLIEFFNLQPERAERIMGEVGRGFTPDEPEMESQAV